MEASVRVDGHEDSFTNRKKLKISWRDVNLGKLGQGVSGCVDLYRTRLSQETYVVKTYHSKEKYETNQEYHVRVLHEYRILGSLHNLHIIEVYKHQISWFGSSVSIYMEAGSVDLHQILKCKKQNGLKTNEMLCLWKQLCLGVYYLHNTAKICHRDLKLHNLVLDPRTGVLKIIDFATAFEFCKNPETGENCDFEFEAIGLVGSEHYMAPETVQQLRYDGKKADIWSVGIILFYMLNGKLPWKSARLSDQRYVAYCSTTGTKESSLLGFATISHLLPKRSHTLVRNILEANPQKRSSIETIFGDSWFEELAVCDNSTCGLDHTILATDIRSTPK